MHIGNVSLLIGLWRIHRIDKTFIRSQMQTAISLQDFGMQYRIDLYGIRFNQLTGCLIISLALDALNFGLAL